MSSRITSDSSVRAASLNTRTSFPLLPISVSPSKESAVMILTKPSSEILATYAARAVLPHPAGPESRTERRRPVRLAHLLQESLEPVSDVAKKIRHNQ